MERLGKLWQTAEEPGNSQFLPIGSVKHKPPPRLRLLDLTNAVPAHESIAAHRQGEAQAAQRDEEIRLHSIEDHDALDFALESMVGEVVDEHRPRRRL